MPLLVRSPSGTIQVFLSMPAMLQHNLIQLNYTTANMVQIQSIQ
jgi:hypothetical protein